MEKDIDLDRFKSYAPRLRRLLFSGWNGKQDEVQIDHVAGCSHLQFDGIDTDSDEYSALQTPLLWVCHNFRAFVHQRFCREYVLTSRRYRDRADALVYSRKADGKKLGYHTHHLAKDLRFKLDIRSVYWGKAFGQLSQEPYKGCAFLLVRKLVFELSIDEIDYLYSPDKVSGYLENWRDPCTPKDRFICSPEAANITAFVKRVKQMAPAVNKVDIKPNREVENLLYHRNVLALDLAQQLFGIIEKHTVITYDSDLVVMYLDLEPIRDLVHIEYFTNGDLKKVMPLLCRSALILQFIDIRTYRPDVTGFMIDLDGGGYLEFPCLETLKLHSSSNTATSQETVFKAIVPLP
ncbi:hypothetical protein GGI17_003228 [Coemansia sp. S146]|nr:hypothetical protein GGI17_003228 [Coemansia sp. S146]